MLSLFLSNWRIIAVGVLVATNLLTYKLWRGEVREFQEYQAAIVAAGKLALEEKVRIEANHEKVLREVKDEYTTSLPGIRAGAIAAYARRYPAGGLCADSGQVRLPGPADSAEGADAAGAKRVAAGCDPAFISDAAQDAMTVKSWQAWAVGNQIKVE